MASNVLAADEPRHPLAIQFSLDRPIDAAAAPFVMAAGSGQFSAEASRSPSTSPADRRMDRARRGGLERFCPRRHQRADPFSRQQAGRAVKAVFVLFNQAPYAIIARKSRGSGR